MRLERIIILIIIIILFNSGRLAKCTKRKKIQYLYLPITYASKNYTLFYICIRSDYKENVKKYNMTPLLLFDSKVVLEV